LLAVFGLLCLSRLPCLPVCEPLQHDSREHDTDNAEQDDDPA
jgi:hypothetical protein